MEKSLAQEQLDRFWICAVLVQMMNWLGYHCKTVSKLMHISPGEK